MSGKWKMELIEGKKVRRLEDKLFNCHSEKTQNRNVILNLIQNLLIKSDRFRVSTRQTSSHNSLCSLVRFVKHGMTRAFTLAEVLITLGVIGVVAAITMPILIKNYQKTVWVNQLKKSVSMLEQGFQMAMADDGVTELENTKLIQSIGEDSSQDNDAFFNEFKKYFKVISIKESGFDELEGYKYLNGQDTTGNGDWMSNAIYFADGSKLILSINRSRNRDNITCNKTKELGGNLCSIIDTAYFNIDVNGDKGPNQLGRDLFVFELGNNGRLYPMFGKDYALFYRQTDLSINNEYWANNNDCNPNSTNSEGYGCAARIIENGWKMDY